MNTVPAAVESPSRRLPVRTSAAALGALLLALAGVLLAPGAWAAAPPGQSWVRAAHAIPGLAGMTFTVTGGPDQATTTLAEDAPYGTVGDYAPLAPGRYTAAVRPPGQPDAEPVLSTTFSVGPSSATTLAAIGTTDAPRLATLTDDLTPPPAGQARVRVLPAAAGAPTVDVEAQGGPVIATAAAFGQASPYGVVPAGSWTLDLSGGGQSATTTVDLAAGGVYTVAITDDEEGGLRVLPVTDAVGTTQAAGSGGGTGDGGDDGDGGAAGTVPAPGAAAPVGGVQTGAGGTAVEVVAAQRAQAHEALWVLAACAALGVAGLAVGRRARS